MIIRETGLATILDSLDVFFNSWMESALTLQVHEEIRGQIYAAGNHDEIIQEGEHECFKKPSFWEKKNRLKSLLLHLFATPQINICKKSSGSSLLLLLWKLYLIIKPVVIFATHYT